jgi:hypothetical protein
MTINPIIPPTLTSPPLQPHILKLIIRRHARLFHPLLNPLPQLHNPPLQPNQHFHLFLIKPTLSQLIGLVLDVIKEDEDLLEFGLLLEVGGGWGEGGGLLGVGGFAEGFLE